MRAWLLASTKKLAWLLGDGTVVSRPSPRSLRPAVGAFADHLVRSRERALRAGTRPRKDITIEHNLGIARDLARFLGHGAVETGMGRGRGRRYRGVPGSAALQPPPTPASFAPVLRLGVQEQVRAGRPDQGAHKLVPVGLCWRDFDLSEQRRLFRRWSGTDAHPHEALVGILALLHALSNTELRSLQVDDFDEARCTLRAGQRPAPVPLDPVSASVLRRCLAHRAATGTHNPHIIVTRQTKTRTTPASTAYMSHVLDAARTSTKRLRSTRIVGLVTVLDAKVAGEALGMKPEGLVGYLADRVDPVRLELTK